MVFLCFPIAFYYILWLFMIWSDGLCMSLRLLMISGFGARLRDPTRIQDPKTLDIFLVQKDIHHILSQSQRTLQSLALNYFSNLPRDHPLTHAAFPNPTNLLSHGACFWKTTQPRPTASSSRSSPQVVNPDGSKTLPDGTIVAADAEEQRKREARFGVGSGMGVGPAGERNLYS